LFHNLEVLIKRLCKKVITYEFRVNVIESFNLIVETSSVMDINFIAKIGVNKQIRFFFETKEDKK
jgi:hypothetical protein